jgi:hypothetical protein
LEGLFPRRFSGTILGLFERSRFPENERFDRGLGDCVGLGERFVLRRSGDASFGSEYPFAASCSKS